MSREPIEEAQSESLGVTVSKLECEAEGNVCKSLEFETYLIYSKETTSARDSDSGKWSERTELRAGPPLIAGGMVMWEEYTAIKSHSSEEEWII